MVATYSVGQLMWLRACAALLVLLPIIWKQRTEFKRIERPWLQLLRVLLSTLEVAAFFLATVYLPLADVITYYLALRFRDRAFGHRARRAGRLAALERDLHRVLRRADRAASVHADRELAGDDRARRQSVVCVPDADHALAAGDAGYRADHDAIRRHVSARCADVADRLGDADRQSRLFAIAGVTSVGLGCRLRRRRGWRRRAPPCACGSASPPWRSRSGSSSRSLPSRTERSKPPAALDDVVLLVVREPVPRREWRDAGFANLVRHPAWHCCDAEYGAQETCTAAGIGAHGDDLVARVRPGSGRGPGAATWAATTPPLSRPATSRPPANDD